MAFICHPAQTDFFKFVVIYQLVELVSASHFQNTNF